MYARGSELALQIFSFAIIHVTQTAQLGEHLRKKKKNIEKRRKKNWRPRLWTLREREKCHEAVRAKLDPLFVRARARARNFIIPPEIRDKTRSFAVVNGRARAAVTIAT